MDDLEQKLKAMRLAAPSEDLDRRIDEIFSTARRPRKKLSKGMLWWWLTGMSAVGGVAAMFLVSSTQPSRPATSAVVYQFEAQDRMRAMLLNSTASRDASPRLDVRVGSQ